MRLWAILPGKHLEPRPYEVRRYLCDDEHHAKRILDACAPRVGGGYTLWRTSLEDHSQWHIAFAIEVDQPSREQEMEQLAARIMELGGREDDHLDAYDAQAFVRRRIAAGLEALDAGRATMEGGVATVRTEAHFGTRRGATLDPKTGDLTVRRTDG